MAADREDAASSTDAVEAVRYRGECSETALRLAVRAVLGAAPGQTLNYTAVCHALGKIPSELNHVMHVMLLDGEVTRASVIRGPGVYALCPDPAEEARAAVERQTRAARRRRQDSNAVVLSRVVDGAWLEESVYRELLDQALVEPRRHGERRCRLTEAGRALLARFEGSGS